MPVNLPLTIRLSLTSLLLSILIASCSSTQQPRDTVSYQRDWPAAPEQPRYRFVMTITSSDDIIPQNDSMLLREMIVGKQESEYQLGRPLDIAARKGMLYLIDADTPLVHVFDLQRRRYFNFGFRFEGKLGQPVGITVDSQGLVYVADRERNAVIVYDSIGLYIQHFTLFGVTTQIAGLAVSPDNAYIYVVDRGGIDSQAHQVIKLNREGEVLQIIGKRGHAEGDFNLPLDITIDNKGYLYVLDSGNFRVQVFDGDGRYVRSFGKLGTGLGQFAQPRSIAIDRDNHLYISDTQFGNIQVFNSEGRLLLPIGELSSELLPGHYSLITGISVDPDNYLYVLDQYQKKLEIFNKLETP